MRFYREKSEIANMTRAAQMNSSSLASAKRLVTIQVVSAVNLKLKYSEVSDVAPFFYYQFFTFDERYSGNGIGTNPKFNDTFSYEVTFDSRAIDYFEREVLEIILFDDNAPIAGVGAEPSAGDDMIGICKVPLKSLVAGCSVHDNFPIRVANGTDIVGNLEIKIGVTELGVNNQDSMHKSVAELQYSKQWEDDIV